MHTNFQQLTYLSHRTTADNNDSTPFVLTGQNYKKVYKILDKYPPNWKRSGIIPLLHLAQNKIITSCRWMSWKTVAKSVKSTKWMCMKSPLFTLCSTGKKLENSIFKFVEPHRVSWEGRNKLSKPAKNTSVSRTVKQHLITWIRFKMSNVLEPLRIPKWCRSMENGFTKT